MVLLLDAFSQVLASSLLHVDRVGLVQHLVSVTVWQGWNVSVSPDFVILAVVVFWWAYRRMTSYAQLNVPIGPLGDLGVLQLSVQWSASLSPSRTIPGSVQSLLG